MDASTCAGCGAQVPTTDVLYTATAEIACKACFERADVAATDGRAALNIRHAATSSIGFVLDQPRHHLGLRGHRLDDVGAQRPGVPPLHLPGPRLRR
jgi:recombinational DNA repair protein (RecF pathway)